MRKISDFYKYKTGVGTNMLIMTVISFVIGLSISGQTFYTFVIENLEKFGALKASGAKGRELILQSRRKSLCQGNLCQRNHRERSGPGRKHQHLSRGRRPHHAGVGR